MSTRTVRLDDALPHPGFAEQQEAGHIIDLVERANARVGVLAHGGPRINQEAFLVDDDVLAGWKPEAMPRVDAAGHWVEPAD
jgi:hypothetical protein